MRTGRCHTVANCLSWTTGTSTLLPFLCRSIPFQHCLVLFPHRLLPETGERQCDANAREWHWGSACCRFEGGAAAGVPRQVKENSFQRGGSPLFAPRFHRGLKWDPLRFKCFCQPKLCFLLLVMKNVGYNFSNLHCTLVSLFFFNVFPPFFCLFSICELEER